jgi:MFS family permease
MATSVVGWLLVYLVGTLAVPLRADLHFGPEALGWAVASSYAGAAVTSIALGRLVERMGGLRTMRAVCLVTAALLLVTAGLVRSWAVLVAVLVLGGVASAGGFVATNHFLARRAPERNRGAAFGLQQSAVPLSTAIAGLAVPALGLTVGWRFAFAAAAVIALGVALAMPRRRPRASPSPRLAPPDARRVRIRPLIPITIGLALGVGAANALTAFLVSAAVAGGLGLAAAGLLAALGGTSAAGMRVVVGVLADRHRGAGFTAVTALLALGGVGYLLLAVADADREALLLAAGTVLAFAAGWGWNGLFYLVVVSAHLDLAARVTSVTQMGGRLGGAVGPLMFGLLVVHGGYSVAWLATAAMALAGAAVILVGGRRIGPAPPLVHAVASPGAVAW